MKFNFKAATSFGTHGIYAESFQIQRAVNDR